MSNSISTFAFYCFNRPFYCVVDQGSAIVLPQTLKPRNPAPPTHTHAENKRSYQKQSDQLAAPPGRIQRQEEQRSKKKGEQKQMGFHDRYEITDHNPAENPPQ